MASKRKNGARQSVPESDSVQEALRRKVFAQNAAEAQKKRAQFARLRQQEAQTKEAESNSNKLEDAVRHVRERKKILEEEEEQDDDDYMPDQDDGERGSGDEQPHASFDAEAQLADGSDTESRMDVDVDGGEEEQEEDEMMRPPAPKHSHTCPAVLSEDSDAEPGDATGNSKRESSLGSAPAPTEIVVSGGVAASLPEEERFAFGILAAGDEDGSAASAGFSQFFNSQFSQEAGLTTQVSRRRITVLNMCADTSRCLTTDGRLPAQQ
jgi:hypothetical protein